MHRALFLDRDGVINVDRGYVCREDAFEFVEGIFDVCREAVGRGFLIVVITNQAGIARGLYSEHQFLALTHWMCEAFRVQGAPIAKVYFCPFHPEHGVGTYKRESIDRKPGPGMILRAAAELGIDLKRSFMVGDRDTDVRAGMAAGVGHNILYRPLPTMPDAETDPVGATVVHRLPAIVTLLNAPVIEALP